MEKEKDRLSMYILVILFIFITSFALYLILSELWRVTWRREVPFVSSPWEIVDKVLENHALPCRGLILDLGAGSGWALRRMWRAGVEGPLVGYERAFTPWFIGWFWNLMTRVPVKLLRQDFKTAPLEEAKGIYLFLLPEILQRLAPEFLRRCPAGTQIVSAVFPIPDWVPERILNAPSSLFKAAKIYLYKI